MFGRYRSIIGSTYCTVINMIIPAVLIVFGFVITPLHTDYMIGIWGFSLACLIESGCEFFGFGPIYRKHNMGMEYLKTACGGADLIRRTVNTDSLCRVFRVTAYVMLPALIHADADNILRFIFAALVLAAVSVWSVNLTRHITILPPLKTRTNP